MYQELKVYISQIYQYIIKLFKYIKNKENIYKIWILVKELYIKNLIWINLGLIALIILLIIIIYCKSDLKILNKLPISIYRDNKLVYESQALKIMDKNDNLYSIVQNNMQYIVYISDKYNLLYKLSDFISLIIYDLQGNLLFMSNLFKQNMQMIHSFNTMDQFINELKLNTITEIPWNKLNLFEVNRNIIFQYKNTMFSLNCHTYNDVLIIQYELQNVSDSKLVYLINNIKDIYSFNHVIQIDNDKVINSNNNLAHNNTTITDLKNIYNKYNNFITYNIYQDQQLLVAHLQLNTLLSIFKTQVNDQLISILSIITSTFNKESNDIIINTNKKISAILTYIQNSLQQIILMNNVTQYNKFNIYELLSPLLHNLKLTFGNIININISALFNVIVKTSRELLEHIITHIYVLSYIYQTNIQVIIEKTMTYIQFTIQYSKTDILIHNLSIEDHILRLDYILSIHDIQTNIQNNSFNFKLSIL